MFLFVHSYCKMRCADCYYYAIQISIIIIIIILLLLVLIRFPVHVDFFSLRCFFSRWSWARIDETHFLLSVLLKELLVQRIKLLSLSLFLSLFHSPPPPITDFTFVFILAPVVSAKFVSNSCYFCVCVLKELFC